MERYEKIAWSRRKWQLRILKKKALKVRGKRNVWTLEEIEYLKEYHLRRFHHKWGWLLEDAIEGATNPTYSDTWARTADKGW